VVKAVESIGNGQRVHAADTCYSFYCYCLPRDRRQHEQRLRAYAYVRAHLLGCGSEVTRTKERTLSHVRQVIRLGARGHLRGRRSQAAIAGV
jgi:hypothetical protein